jgi:hypothetical protein
VKVTAQDVLLCIYAALALLGQALLPSAHTWRLP